MEKSYYTVSETAELLGLKENTIRVYLTQGRLKGDKIYNSTVIPKEEIERYQLEQLDWGRGI